MYAARQFGLPANLKLSVHSGSDQFSLYPIICERLAAHNAGLHLKTAGTTWREELAGLAEAGGDRLTIAQEIYAQALRQFDEVCAPYATVIQIDRSRLPPAAVVQRWSCEQFVRALTHEPQCPDFNPYVRQLLHVGFQIAAELGERFHAAVEAHRTWIAARVEQNLYQRHRKPLFLG